MGLDGKWGRKDGDEVQEERKFMFHQDIQSPREKKEVDLCDNLIQGYPQILIVHAI